jgi:hypothetical protein
MIENIYNKLLQSPQYYSELVTRLAARQRRRLELAEQIETLRYQTPPRAAANISPPNEEARANRERTRTNTFAIHDHSISDIAVALNRSMDEQFNVQTSLTPQAQFKPSCFVLPNDAVYNVQEPDECPICYTDIKQNEHIKKNCNHKYCIDCMQNMYKTAVCSYKTSMSCAICRAAIENVTTYVEIPDLFQM